jgi:TetR/AcrR family transcriptional regulator
MYRSSWRSIAARVIIRDDLQWACAISMAVDNSDFEVTSITRIMKAAREEFIRHGLVGTRLESIAKSAGVSCQLIYHYYGSKQSLYQEMLVEVARDSIQFLRTADLDNLPPWEALSYVIHGIFDQSAKGYGRLLAEQVVHYGAHVSGRNSAPSNHSAIIDALDRVLIRGQQSGIFRAEIIASDLFIAIVSMSVAHLNWQQAFALPDGSSRRGATSNAEWQEFSIALIERGIRL